MLKEIPNGLNELYNVFGDPEDKDFEGANIVSFDFPYSLLYAGKRVNRGRCHRLVVDNFKAAFEDILRLGLAPLAKNYGGIYNMRWKRGCSNLSVHAWGIAIDLEADRFPLGSDERFPSTIVKAFQAYGFFYGGDFKTRKDPMHFQLCTGY